MEKVFSRIISSAIELASYLKSRIHSHELALVLWASSLVLSWCESGEKEFDANYDAEGFLTEQLADYKSVQTSKGKYKGFDTKDYSKEIELWNHVADQISNYIAADTGNKQTLYIIDVPWYVGIIVNNKLKEQGVNTTLGLDIDFSDEWKMDDVDYSTLFGILNKVWVKADDEHMVEERWDQTITKPYALLFDYGRFNSWLNDLEGWWTFHNQYTIEEDVPGKEMFKGEGASRNRIVVFSPKELNPDLSWSLIEYAKVDAIPVNLVILNESWNLVETDIPDNIKVDPKSSPHPETPSHTTVHSTWMPFRYWYYLWTNHASGHSWSTNYYSGSHRSASFRSNGTTTVTTPSHFQRSNPVRSNSRVSWSSIRSGRGG